MLKTFCKELVEYSIKSALCTVVTIGTLGFIGGFKEKIENSKKDKNEEKNKPYHQEPGGSLPRRLITLLMHRLPDDLPYR